jgi:hypothetical protein
MQRSRRLLCGREGTDASCWSMVGRPGLAAPPARWSLVEVFTWRLAALADAEGKNCGLRVLSIRCCCQLTCCARRFELDWIWAPSNIHESQGGIALYGHNVAPPLATTWLCHCVQGLVVFSICFSCGNRQATLFSFFSPSLGPEPRTHTSVELPLFFNKNGMSDTYSTCLFFFPGSLWYLLLLFCLQF